MKTVYDYYKELLEEEPTCVALWTAAAFKAATEVIDEGESVELLLEEFRIQLGELDDALGNP